MNHKTLGPRPFGLEEIDGLLVSPGKAYMYELLTDYQISGKPLRSEPVQEKWFKSNHPFLVYLDSSLYK